MNSTDVDTTPEPDTGVSPAEQVFLRNAKIGVLFGVLAITLIGSAFPWIFRRCLRKSAVVMSIGMCFAGGVILGAGLSHLAPDSTDAWETYLATTTFEHSDYPFGQLLAGGSLLLLVAVDRIVVGWAMKEESHAMEPGHSGPGHGHMLVNVPDDHDHEGHANHGNHANHGSHAHGGAEPKSELKDSGAQGSYLDDDFSRGGSSGEDVTSYRTSTPSNVPDEESGRVVSTAPPKKQTRPDKEGRGGMENQVRAWVFFVALSLHSIFDGLSVGGETDMEGFYALLIAVLAHKVLDGFALGAPIYMGKLPVWQTITAIVFCALMTPVGIVIGMLATEKTEGSQALLARAIVLSVSYGSFLFISLVELLPTGLAMYGWVKVKIMFVILGWGLMVLIAVWV